MSWNDKMVRIDDGNRAEEAKAFCSSFSVIAAPAKSGESLLVLNQNHVVIDMKTCIMRGEK